MTQFISFNPKQLIPSLEMSNLASLNGVCEFDTWQDLAYLVTTVVSTCFFLIAIVHGNIGKSLIQLGITGGLVMGRNSAKEARERYQLSAIIPSFESQVESLEGQNEALNNKIASLETLTVDYGRENDLHKKFNEDQGKLVKETFQMVNSWSEQAKAHEYTVKSLSKEIVSHQQTLQSLREDIQKDKAENEKLKRELSKLREGIQMDYSKLQQASNNLAQGAKQFEQASNTIAQKANQFQAGKSSSMNTFTNCRLSHLQKSSGFLDTTSNSKPLIKT